MKATTVVLLVLLGVDAAFIGIYFWQMPHGWDMLPEPLFSLGWDRSLAEVFQYGKLLATAAMMVAIGRRWRSPGPIGIAAVLLLVLADDVVTLHEHMGRAMTRWFTEDGVVSVRAEDYGEMISMVGLMGVSLVILMAVHARSGPYGRRLVWCFCGFLAAFGFFAGVVDLIHENTSPFMLRVVMGALEDGGEMVVVSVLVWFALRQWRGAMRLPEEPALAVLSAETLRPGEKQDVTAGQT